MDLWVNFGNDPHTVKLPCPLPPALMQPCYVLLQCFTSATDLSVGCCEWHLVLYFLFPVLVERLSQVYNTRAVTSHRVPRSKLFKRLGTRVGQCGRLLYIWAWASHPRLTHLLYIQHRVVFRWHLLAPTHSPGGEEGKGKECAALCSPFSGEWTPSQEPLEHALWQVSLAVAAPYGPLALRG